MAQITFALTWGNYYATGGQTGGSIVFPFVPNDGIKLHSETNNQTYETLSGPILLLGKHNLRSFGFESFLPGKSKTYSFMNAASSMTRRVPRHDTQLLPGMNHAFGGGSYSLEVSKDGTEIIAELEAIRKKYIPMRAIYTKDDREIFNMPCTISSLEWGYDLAGDIAFSMQFIEYNIPTYNLTELGQIEDPDDATETANTECDPSVFQTASEASSSSGGSYTRIADANYSDDDIKTMCKHLVSGGTYMQDTYYYNPSNRKIMPTTGSGYTTPVSREKIIECEVWCVCNTVNYLGYKSLSACMAAKFNDQYFDWKPNMYNKYNNNFTNIWNGYNMEATVKKVLDQWSDIQAGNDVPTAAMPTKYTCQFGGAAGYYSNSTALGQYALTYYFDYYVYAGAGCKLADKYKGIHQKLLNGEGFDPTMSP